MADDSRVRPYDPDRDPRDIWDLKRGFEMGLGSGTGDDDKRIAYEGKLTEAYGERYLDWVFWCTKHDPRCVTVAETSPEESDGDDATTGIEGETTDVETTDGDAESTDDGTTDGETTATDAETTDLAGYVFVLPQQLAMIWDAAVLNELYVRPEHRGTGVADDLMDAAVALAETQDLPLDRLVLDVDRENDRAQAFYERHGFEHWGEMVARELE